MSRYSWKNVPGRVYIEDICLDGVWKHDGKSLPAAVQPMLYEAFPNADSKTSLDLDIDFLSSGSYDTGKISGPPEDCYPPESEDERTPETLTLKGGGRVVVLGGKVADAMFDHFKHRVEAVELDTDRDSYPPDDEDH